MADAMDLSPVSKLATDFRDLLQQPTAASAECSFLETGAPARRHLFPAYGTAHPQPEACGDAMVSLNDACSSVPTFKKPLPPSASSAQQKRSRKHLAPSDRRRGGSFILPSSPTAPHHQHAVTSSSAVFAGPLPASAVPSFVEFGSSSCGQLPLSRRTSRAQSFCFGEGGASAAHPQPQPQPQPGCAVILQQSSHNATERRGSRDHVRSVGSCPTARRTTADPFLSASGNANSKSLPALPVLTFDRIDDALDLCEEDDESNKENATPQQENANNRGASPYRPPLFSLTASSSAVLCVSPSDRRSGRSGSMTDRSHHHHQPQRRSSAVALFSTGSSNGPSASPTRDRTSTFGLASSSMAVPVSPYSGAASPSRDPLAPASSPFSDMIDASGAVPTVRRTRTRPGRALTISCSSLPVMTQPESSQSSSGHHSLHREPHVPVLPTNPHASHSDLPCIEPTTLMRLLSGEFDSLFTRLFIVDCRFKYEYDGGHIRGAINLNTTHDVEKHFVLNPIPLREKVCIIFHCEFSSHRGPVLCRYLRSWDRRVHEHCYPELYYPEMYVLEGGYKKFWETPNAQVFCEPQAYVPMKEAKFAKEMKSGLASIRNFSAKKGSGSLRSRSWTVESRDELRNLVRPVRFPPLASAPSPLAQDSTSAIDFED